MVRRHVQAQGSAQARALSGTSELLQQLAKIPAAEFLDSLREADHGELYSLSGELLRVLDFASISIEIVDLEKRYVFVNRAFEALTGYNREEAIGKTPAMMRPPGASDEDYASIAETVRGSMSIWEGTYRRQRRDGSIYRFKSRIAPVLDGEGNARLFVAVGSDVTEESESRELLERFAFFDALTGLPNRLLFRDRLTHRLSQLRRQPHSLGAVLFLDIDGFKQINDQYGHDAGDRLLVEVAHRLASATRSSDTVSRLGGDEFCVLLDRLEERSDAIQVADALHQLLQEPIEIAESLSIRADASIGITFLHTGASNMEAVMREADSAMYRAKAADLPYVVFDRQLDAELREQRQLQHQLTRALERDEFDFCTSFVEDAQTQQRKRVRLDIIWRRGPGQVLSHNEWYDLVAISGEVYDITRWQLDRAIRLIEEYAARGCRMPIEMSINRHAITDARVIEMFREIADSGRIRPKALYISLAPSRRNLVYERIKHPLLALQKLGYPVLLEGFGQTSYTIADLLDFPVAGFSLSSSFTNQVLNPRVRVTLSAVLQFAQGIGREMVANDVQSQEVRQAFRDLGWPSLQGPAISPTLAPARLWDWFALEEPERARQALERVSEKG